MKYVLDTNTLSFLMAGEKAVAERLLECSRTDLLLPQPVIAEIEYGLSRLPRSKREERLRRRFELYLAELPRAQWTNDVSRAFGRAKASLERRGQRLEDLDLAVAAHALAIDGTLVSDDEGMKRVAGLVVESWR